MGVVEVSGKASAIAIHAMMPIAIWIHNACSCANAHARS